MKLVNLIPLKEIDFRNQDQFDDYQQQHSLRPDTKVTIAGKPQTVAQASKNSEPTKGSSVFGKDSGGSVFNKAGGASAKSDKVASKPDSMATVNSIAAKTGLRAQAVAGWADENGVNLSKVSADIDSKKLKPMDMMTAVSGNPGNKYAKDIIAKYSQSGNNISTPPKSGQIPKEVMAKMDLRVGEDGNEFRYLSTKDGGFVYGIAKEDGEYYVTLGTDDGDIVKSFGKAKNPAKAADIFMKNLDMVKSKLKLEV
jgi:hypothetical protein